MNKVLMTVALSRFAVEVLAVDFRGGNHHSPYRRMNQVFTTWVSTA